MVLKIARTLKPVPVRTGRHAAGFRLIRVNRDLWHILDRDGFVCGTAPTHYHAEREAERLAERKGVKLES